MYNLQTETGWYLANGIVTHNCRCARAPQTKSWADLGLDIDEPPSLLPDAEATFKSLSKSDQLAVLGPKRFDAWQAGDYPMSKWATRRSTKGWRDSYVPSKPPRKSSSSRRLAS